MALTITQGTRQLLTVMLVGQSTTRPDLATPWTETAHELELPQRSVTVMVTVALGPGTIVPGGGDCEYTKSQTGVQLSVALTEMAGMTIWQLEFNATITALLGQWIIGAVVSTTVTVWLQDLASPQASSISQVRVMTCGQIPLVTVFATVISTLLVVPLMALVQHVVAVG